MKFNKYLICALFLVLICCIGAASAAEADDVVAADDAIDEEVTEAVDVSDEIDEDSLGVSEEPALSDGEDTSSDEGYVIYVGQNSENGNGSENNPFSSFDLACDNISSGKENVIIKVFDGTYELGNYLKFNATNIHILGLGDNVIIKNKYTGTTHDGIDSQQAFGLIPTSGNFTISNVIFDGSTWSSGNDNNFDKYYFNVFKGAGDYTVTLDNCSFLEYNYFLPRGDSSNPYQFIFNNCKIFSVNPTTYKWGSSNQHNILFKYCIFNVAAVDPIGANPKKVKNYFEDCWFGINGIPVYLKTTYNYYFNSYAIFTISENYLGNNDYELIGKLVRNGTSEIIEGINPMVVTLNVDYGGELNQKTAILKNGTFKVLYTSTSSDNKVTATLDEQPVSVEFKNINISLDSPVITYGDKQNITVTLPENTYNAVMTVIVNGKSYTKDVEFGDGEITVDITDVLPVGTHDVQVTFVDEIDNPACPIYAFNTTKITVNKATPNIAISPEGNLIPGEKLIIKVEIPYATENVTIIVNGDKNNTKLVDGVATYTIDELVQGTYYVTVLYAGDASYDFAYKTDSFDVVKSTQELIKDLNDTVNAQAGVIESQKEQIGVLNDTVNAQAGVIVNQTKQIGVLNDTVNAQAGVIVNQTKQIIDLNNTINAQNNTTNPQKDTNNQKNTVSKKATKLTAPKKTFKAKTKTKKVKVKLTSGKTVLKNKKVTLKVKGKTYTAKTNKKGIATFKITKLSKKGTFKYTVKFAGDKSYKAASKNGKIKIK